MDDPETVQLLKGIHKTLELVAFLLAVLLAGTGGVGTIVGGLAAVLLAVNAFGRYVGDRNAPQSAN